MSPVALAVKIEAIKRDIDAGLFISEIVAKHGVAWDLVRELAFGTDDCCICDECSGSGLLEGQGGKTTGCDKCKGGGYTCP